MEIPKFKQFINEEKGDKPFLRLLIITDEPEEAKTLETKYDDDAGDWYVALGWLEKRAIVKMDSVLGTITEIKEI